MFFSKNNLDLDEQMLSLNIMKRVLLKQSNKARKQQKLYYAKARESVSSNDMDRASIYASQSVKHKTLSLRYLNLSMRVEIVQAMAKSAIDSGMITDGVANVISTVTTLASPKFIVNNVDRFEQMFDDLSIASGTLEGALDVVGGVGTHVEDRDVKGMLDLLANEVASNKEGAMPHLPSVYSSSQVDEIIMRLPKI